MKVAEILKKEGIEFKRFAFEGHCDGESDGFPIVVGHYDTVRYGILDIFKTGADIVGEWVKVYEYCYIGDAAVPSEYVAYYVKRGDYKKAIEALAKNGIKPVVVALPEVKEEEERLRKIIARKLKELDLAKLTRIMEILSESNP